MQVEESTEGMLQQFVRSMIEKRGDKNANEGRLLDGLADAIDAAVLNSLPTSSLEKMAELDDEGKLTPEAYDEILGEAGIDQNNIVLGAMTGFRDAYLRGEVA